MRRPWQVLRLVPLLFVLVTGSAAAQSFAIDRGAWTLGGTASISTMRVGNPSVRFTLISLHPQVGLFVRRGVLVGVTLPFQATSVRGNRSTSYGVGPSVRYFFARSPRRFYPYVSAAATFDWVRRTQAPDSVSAGATENAHDQTYDAAAGIAAMLSSDVAVAGEAYYEEHRSGTKVAGLGQYTLKTTSLGVRFGLNVFLH